MKIGMMNGCFRMIPENREESQALAVIFSGFENAVKTQVAPLIFSEQFERNNPELIARARKTELDVR